MTQVGSVYGEALYELASAEDLTKQILEEMRALCAGFREEPSFIRLLRSPNLAKQERIEIIDRCFASKVHVYLLNFLKILTEKGYIHHFDDCTAAFEQLFNRDHNILPVTAVTAVQMNPEQISALTAKLSGITGKSVVLRNRIDSSCIGGVRLDYDGLSLDDTVSARMASIRETLKNTVL